MFESLLTPIRLFRVRVPHNGEVQVDPRKFVVSLISNGAEMTRDLANACALFASASARLDIRSAHSTCRTVGGAICSDIPPQTKVGCSAGCPMSAAGCHALVTAPSACRACGGSRFRRAGRTGRIRYWSCRLCGETAKTMESGRFECWDERWLLIDAAGRIAGEVPA